MVIIILILKSIHKGHQKVYTTCAAVAVCISLDIIAVYQTVACLIQIDSRHV